MENYYVLIVSDGTGETGFRLLKAAMQQFDADILITRYAKVRQKKQIREEPAQRPDQDPPPLVAVAQVDQEESEGRLSSAERERRSVASYATPRAARG